MKKTRMFKIGSWLLVSCLAVAAVADPSTKQLMNQFLQEMNVLKKYFFSEEKFKDPKNEGEIAKHLKEFARLASEAKHDPALQSENFKFSQQVLENYISDTERLFRLGNKSFARWKLASATSVCMSCHTQMMSTTPAFNDFNNLAVLPSKFERAEFLFATRSFDKAFEMYGEIISEFPENKYNPREVETALERQLVYFTRLKRDPQAGLKEFKNHAQNKKLPPYILTNIAEWIRGLERWQKNPAPNPATASADKILAYAKNTLDYSLLSKIDSSQDPNLVSYLSTSGILYEFLQKNPRSKATPEILYYLSVCDRYVSSTFYYSLADLYLRECITKYPDLPIARKCYREYEMETILGYTGSSGTNLPADVEADLKALKKLISSGGKMKLKSN